MPHHKRKRFFQMPLKIHWHTICLTVFLVIVFCDLNLQPIIIEYLNSTVTQDQVVQEALKFSNPADQIAALQLLNKQQSWQPLTLQQGGLFYAAFGAILGIGAWKRTIPDVGANDDSDNDNSSSNNTPAPAPAPTNQPTPVPVAPAQ